MNPFTNPELAAGYEVWYETEGRRADRLEKRLLARLLRRFPDAESILDIGCGTGHFTRWFHEQGLRPTGLDASPAMLVEAERRNTHAYVQGDAHALPFADDAFDLAALVTSLEFLNDPERALQEARRVARQGVILGVLNARSRLGRQYKQEGGPIWETAHFYTPAELRQLVERVVGPSAAIIWRTTLWPYWPRSLPLPGGGFIGLAVSLA